MDNIMHSRVKAALNRLLHKFQNRSKVTSLLITGASWSFIINVLSTGTFFGAHVLVARLTGAKSYGDYLYVLTLINILALLCKLGLDVALLRFIPLYRVRAEWGLMSGLLRRVKQVCFIVSMVCAAGIALVIKFIWNHMEGELAYTYLLACMVLPATVFIQIYAAKLQALKHILFSQVPQEIIRPMALILLAMLGFMAIGLPTRATTIMTLEVISIVIALSASVFLFRKSLPFPVYGVQPEYQTITWLKTSLPLSLLEGSRIIMKQSDIIMVGLFLGTTHAGIYGVATRVAMLLGFGLNAVYKIAAPLISELYAEGKMKELQRMVSLAAFGILVFSVLACLIIIALGKFMLGLFGTPFVNGYVALLILLIGQLISSLTGITGGLMSMTGHQKQAAKLSFISVAANIFLNIVLIPIMGITGAALSTSFSIAFWNIAMMLYIRKKLGIDSTGFSLVGCKI